MDLHVLRSISKRTCENGVQDMVDTDDPRSSQSEAAGGTDNCSCSNPHRTFFDPQAAVLQVIKGLSQLHIIATYP